MNYIHFRFFKPWLGDGLLISNGQKWYSHRKIIAPAFHISVLKSFVPLFYENSWSLVKRLRDQVGKEFDCHDYLSAITVDILMETAMGIRGVQKDKNSFDYAMAVMKYISFYYYTHTFIHASLVLFNEVTCLSYLRAYNFLFFYTECAILSI